MLRLRHLLAPLVAVLAFGTLSVGAPAAHATESASNSITTVISSTPLDPVTGKVIGPTVVLSPSTSSSLHASSVDVSAWWGTPSATGRHLFRVDMTHNLGCFFNFCVSSYHHITDVDATWVYAWRWVHANGVAKYTPVGNSYIHFQGESQTYGNDQQNYYPGPESAFHYRGTAQNVMSYPHFPDAWLQDANDMTIFPNGMMVGRVRNSG
jgi:hypothetical protein